MQALARYRENGTTAHGTWVNRADPWAAGAATARLFRATGFRGKAAAVGLALVLPIAWLSVNCFGDKLTAMQALPANAALLDVMLTAHIAPPRGGTHFIVGRSGR